MSVFQQLQKGDIHAPLFDLNILDELEGFDVFTVFTIYQKKTFPEAIFILATAHDASVFVKGRIPAMEHTLLVVLFNRRGACLIVIFPAPVFQVVPVSAFSNENCMLVVLLPLAILWGLAPEFIHNPSKHTDLF